MTNHVLRPLWVAIGAISLLLLVRHFVVPDDFGVHGKNFTYGFHRLGSIADWQNFPMKYRGKDYCQECHPEELAAHSSSKHNLVECENCHGPAVDHPDNPEKLEIDRSRGLCLRCHAELSYPGILRSEIPGIDPEKHNQGSACAECHNPHKPDLEGGRI